MVNFEEERKIMGQIRAVQVFYEQQLKVMKVSTCNWKFCYSTSGPIITSISSSYFTL